MFTLIVMVYKRSEIANFLYFLLITAKRLSQFGQYVQDAICSRHMEDIIELLQKMAWLIGFGLNCL